MRGLSLRPLFSPPPNPARPKTNVPPPLPPHHGRRLRAVARRRRPLGGLSFTISLIMLVSFNVTNYKVFRDRVELSLVASPNGELADDNVVDTPVGLRLLKSAVVYGANASGKTKLIDALAFMKQFVLRASLHAGRTQLTTIPFRLNLRTAEEPSEFEIVFWRGASIYRYGFAVAGQTVGSEWLYRRPTGEADETELLFRDGESTPVLHPDVGAEITKFLEIKGPTYHASGLLLALGAQLDNPIATDLTAGFEQISIHSGLNLAGLEPITFSKALNNEPLILQLLQAADIGIHDLDIRTLAPDEMPDSVPAEEQERIRQKTAEDPNARFYDRPRTAHVVFNDEGQPQPVQAVFDLYRDGSNGTRKLFALAGALIDVLTEGRIWVVDELDSRLHPNLVVEIVRLFNSREHNPRGAQLIFNTHDTNLLRCGYFRHDQIWFTEKDYYGAATLYSLADIKGIQPGDNVVRDYLQGRYGAVPFLGGFATLLNADSIPIDERKA